MTEEERYAKELQDALSPPKEKRIEAIVCTNNTRRGKKKKIKMRVLETEDYV